MVSLLNHKDRQAVRYLPFCYLCGREFSDADAVDGDHVPPEVCFSKEHRVDPLKLKTHKACNNGHSVTDKRIGQLIGLKTGRYPSKRDYVLGIKKFASDLHFVEFDIPTVVWGWVRGFHSALYREPFIETQERSLVLPFPRADLALSGLDPQRRQHELFVDVIKTNRAFGNLDVVRSNLGKLVYECVWMPSNDDKKRVCIFALDIYGWKDLGNPDLQAPRGCTGSYAVPTEMVPATATIGKDTPIIIPNVDRLDPFAP